MRDASTLNSDSRTRSVVGRVPDARHRDSAPAELRRRRCPGHPLATDHHQQVAALDLRGGRDRDTADLARLGCGDRGLHLHRLDGGDGLSGVDRSPASTLTVTTPANGAATWSGLVRSAFSAVGNVAGDAPVAHHHRPELAVEDAHHRAHAALVGVGDRFQPDQQLDTALQPDPVFVAVAQPVEELVGRAAWTCRRTVPGEPRIPLSEPGNSSRFSAACRFGPACVSTVSSSATERPAAAWRVGARQAPWCATVRASHPAGRRVHRAGTRSPNRGCRISLGPQRTRRR